MKILIVDRDELSANMIKSRLEPLGHTIEIHPDKGESLERIAADEWDVVFLDPAPMTHVKPMSVQLRRNIRNNVYMVLLSNTLTLEHAIESGFNDILPKPMDPTAVVEIVERAQFMNSLLAHLADEKTDFPSAGGVIAKSAYNQLFYPALTGLAVMGKSPIQSLSDLKITKIFLRPKARTMPKSLSPKWRNILYAYAVNPI